MKKYFIILLVFVLTGTNLFSQSIDSEPKKINSSSSIFVEYALLEVEFYKNGEGEMKNKNVNSTIFGLSQHFTLSKSFDGIAAYSLLMLPDKYSHRTKLLKTLINKKKFFCFAVEDITVKVSSDINEINDLWKIKKTLMSTYLSKIK